MNQLVADGVEGARRAPPSSPPLRQQQEQQQRPQAERPLGPQRRHLRPPFPAPALAARPAPLAPAPAPAPVRGPPRGRGGGVRGGGVRGGGGGGDGGGRERRSANALLAQHPNPNSLSQFQLTFVVNALADTDDPTTLARELGGQHRTWLTAFANVAATRAVVDAGVRPDRVSFQRCVVPLLHLVTRPLFTRCGARAEVSAVFAALHGAQIAADVEPPFDLRLLLNLLEMLKEDTVADPNWDAAAQRELRARRNHLETWEPETFNDVVAPIAAFALESAIRFPQDAGHPLYAELHEALARAADRPDVGAEARRCVERIGRELEARRWEQNEVDLAREARARRPIFREAVQPLTRGPGPLSETGQPRHDNDEIDFRRVRVVPTADELQALRDPYLPANRAAAWHHAEHLAEETFGLAPALATDFDSPADARLLDTHFRLLREDLARSMRLARPGERTGVGQRFPALRVTGASIDGRVHHGVVVEIRFRDPTRGPRADRIEKWTRTRWLQLGSLVSIARGDAVTHALVASRDVKGGLVEPGGVDRQDFHSCILVRCVPGSAGNETDTALTVWQWVSELARDGVAPVEMRQATLDFFAFRPVLQGLQRVERLPFAGRFAERRVPNLTAAPPTRPAPRYSNGVFDLRDLAARPEAHDRLAACDLTAPESVTALRDLITLDENQMVALRCALTTEVGLIQGYDALAQSRRNTTSD